MNNIAKLIIKENKNRLNNTAIIDGAYSISYSQLFTLVDLVALELKRKGVIRFKRIALLCEDSVDYIVLSLAVLKLQAVIVPVPIGASSNEVNCLLNDIKVDLIIFEKDSYNSKKTVLSIENNVIKKSIFITECGSYRGLSKDFAKLNPAFIRFTSGTTGKNKGVVLSHQTIVARTDAANNGLKVTSKDRVIWVLSMSFHFVVTILLFLRRGATIIISSRQFPYELLNNLKKLKPSLIYASPIHYHMLCNLDIPKESLATLRLAVSTAVKLSPDIADKFYKKFGFEVSEAYGVIEIGLPFINLSKNQLKRGSVGKITSGYQVMIKDPDNHGVGLIYIKGKGIFDAYFSPWRKASDILENGWFNTGDLGYLDKQGFLFILGRRKSVINFCGMKIFPFEVESVINRYPQVKESLVYGKSHPQYGQLPLVKVVLRRLSKGSFDSEKLRKFCYAHLSSYKVPKEFIFIDKLTRTPSGKIKLAFPLKSIY